MCKTFDEIGSLCLSVSDVEVYIDMMKKDDLSPDDGQLFFDLVDFIHDYIKPSIKEYFDEKLCFKLENLLKACLMNTKLKNSFYSLTYEEGRKELIITSSFKNSKLKDVFYSFRIKIDVSKHG